MKPPLALLLLLVVARSLCAAGADDAAKTFDQLFADEVRQVRLTADSRDDIDLARRLMTAADSVAEQPAMAALLLEKAHELTAKVPQGSSTAIAAMEALGVKMPERREAANQKIVAILQRDFARAAKADEQVAAGQALVDKMMEMAEQAAAHSEFAAMAHLNQALPVAAKIKSPSEASIRARLAALTRRQRTQAQVAALKERILKDRTDKAAAGELIMLLIVDLDKPAQAAPYLDIVADEDLGKHVALASKEPAELAAADHLALGLWYEGLARKAAAASRRLPFQRSEESLEKYLEMQGEQNLTRLQAEVALKRVKAAMLALPAEAGGKESSAWASFDGKPLKIEAESAQIILKPMQASRGRGASGGSFVAEPEERDPKKQEQRGQLIFHVKSSGAADAYLWVRVRSDVARQLCYLGVSAGRLTVIAQEPPRMDLPRKIIDWTWVKFAADQTDAIDQLGPDGKPTPAALAAQNGAIHLRDGFNSIAIMGARQDDSLQIDAIYLSKTASAPQ